MNSDKSSLQKEKSLFGLVGTADIIGYIVAIIGAAASICAAFKNPILSVICIFISQCLLLVGWGVLFFNKYKYKRVLLEKNQCIDELNTVVENKENEYRNRCEELEKTRVQMIKQLSTMSNCVKSNNIHNNDMLVRIPSEADEQYALLERLEELSDDSDESQRKKLQDEAIESAQKYAGQLFELFNRYCRVSTDEAVKLQNAYMTLKGMAPKVSITVKLMNQPYHPERDRSEDIKVYTAFRDNEAYGAGEREIGEQLYTIGGNSDFVACLKKDYFIINRAEKQGDSYSNEHRGYNEFYNSAIVVPIRIKRGDGRYKFFGYYCCDCLSDDQEMEAFDKSAAQYLFAFAQNMGTFLETLDANWIDRYKAFEDVSDNILEMLYKKVCNH